MLVVSSDLTMASHWASFAYDFVKKPSDEYFCPITFEILKDPQQTKFCCGKHLSRVAADSLKREGKPCPICKRAPLQTSDDMFFQKQVLALMVRCNNKALGCKWEGELGKLEQHLMAGSAEGECQYASVACPNECGIQLQRRSLYKHKTKQCIKPQSICQYCNEKAANARISNEHWSQCQKYPLQCPNKCEEKAIERCFLKRHLDQHCPLREIECKFSYAGCEVRTQRRKMQEHMDQSRDEHILALADYVKMLSENLHIHSLALAKLAPHPIFIVPPLIRMDDFEQKKQNNVTWYSPSFYSHVGGYKMCISVFVNGYGKGEGTHIGMGIFMKRGEFDDHLKWPFKGKIQIHLINQRKGGEHVEWRSKINEHQLTKTILNKHFSRVLEGERAAGGWGFETVISHSDLYKPKEGKEYLKNDTLEFKISQITLLDS